MCMQTVSEIFHSIFVAEMYNLECKNLSIREGKLRIF